MNQPLLVLAHGDLSAQLLILLHQPQRLCGEMSLSGSLSDSKGWLARNVGRFGKGWKWWNEFKMKTLMSKLDVAGRRVAMIVNSTYCKHI